MVHVVRETFPNFDVLISTLAQRPNNEPMRRCSRSKDGDYNFTKTESYNDAVSLLRDGYTEVLPQIKNSLENQEKILSKLYLTPKHVPCSSVVGFVPNIPNAIRNLPNSMINIVREPRKRRTVSIIYCMASSWDKPTSFFIDAGVALVSAINILERYGIQTKFTIVFKGGLDDRNNPNEICMADVCIKDFGQRFNLQKICFPLVHPSMFRRIGFKWMETSPKITSYDFASGYGFAFRTKEEVLRYIPIPQNTHIITSEWINSHNNSTTEVLKELELI